MILIKSFEYNTRCIELFSINDKYIVKDNQSDEYNNVVFLNKESALMLFNKIMEVKNDIAL
jgi:hypothetical protein